MPVADIKQEIIGCLGDMAQPCNSYPVAAYSDDIGGKTPFDFDL